MKIGILTFHRSINYGAVTQCYVLSEEIKKRFPSDTVEVIDYVPEFRINKYKPSLWRFLFGSTNKKNSFTQNAKIVMSQTIRAIKHPEDFRLLKTRYEVFQKSMRCLPLSCVAYRDNDAELFRGKICGEYDVIVVGSDCVWEWTTVPLPSAYYLHGDYGAKKVSFAASAGTDDYEKLSLADKQLLCSALEDFSYIGVRDSSTERVVNQASRRVHFYHNCDPTTLLDASTLEEYRSKAKARLIEAGITFDKPIVGVMCNNKLGKVARDIFGDTVQYVGLYIPNQHCDVNLLDLEVLEWAAIFGLFDMTITTFFHGTMLSLVNLTPVLSFDYLPETDLQHTKLHELYDRLDLPGFYHRDKATYSAEDIEQLKLVAHRLLKEPPKTKIREALDKEADYSESFFAYLESLHE